MRRESRGGEGKEDEKREKGDEKEERKREGRGR